MKTITIAILAIASLLSFAAAPPRDPCVIVWDIETPLLWTAGLSDHGKQIIVVSTTVPQATDPIWWDLQVWADQNAVPDLSPLAGCMSECKSTCLPGTVKRVKFKAAGPNGEPPQECECECYPVGPTTNPPVVPPNGSAD